jgi:hypothetical protein
MNRVLRRSMIRIKGTDDIVSRVVCLLLLLVESRDEDTLVVIVGLSYGLFSFIDDLYLAQLALSTTSDPKESLVLYGLGGFVSE